MRKKRGLFEKNTYLSLAFCTEQYKKQPKILSIMKKIIMLVCAAALVGGANAQVFREVGEPLKATLQAESPILQNVKGNAAKSARDSVPTESYYTGSANGGFNLTMTATGLVNGFADLGKIPSVWLPMGTGWMNNYWGSGEIGYSFDFNNDGWYLRNLRVRFAEKYVTGAIALVGRIPSSVDSINRQDMPLYFKHYNGDKVSFQTAFADMTGNSTNPDAEIDVFYPKDPDDFSSESEITYVYMPETSTSTSGGLFPGQDFFGAKFKNPKLAGANTCISVVFPHDGLPTDTLWNALLFGPQNDAGSITSTRLAPVYVVWDFDKQFLYTYNGNDGEHAEGEPVRERMDDFLPFPEDQPNERYIVLPHYSWWWANGGGPQDDEPIMRVLVADEVSVKSPNPQDKYVEVTPVPAIDNVTISATSRILNVDIYDLNGKLLKTEACNSSVATVSVSGLQTGMYIAKITTEEGMATKKVVVR